MTYPIQKGLFESDVSSLLFRFQPFMAEDFFSFGEKFLVQARFSREASVRFGLPGFFHFERSDYHRVFGFEESVWVGAISLQRRLLIVEYGR